MKQSNLKSMKIFHIFINLTFFSSTFLWGFYSNTNSAYDHAKFKATSPHSLIFQMVTLFVLPNGRKCQRHVSSFGQWSECTTDGFITSFNYGMCWFHVIIPTKMQAVLKTKSVHNKSFKNSIYFRTVILFFFIRRPLCYPFHSLMW